MIWYALLAVIGYVAFFDWLIFGRGPFRQTYNPVIGWLLRARGMQAITLGPTCYLYERGAKLSEQGAVHEQFHYMQQQRKRPLTFFPRYIVLLIFYGYDKHPDEQQARAAAGEPLR